MATRWRSLSRGGYGGATRRVYNLSQSFSIKTNILWEKLLGISLLDDDGLMLRECEIYKSTARPFGWILDERGMTTNITNIANIAFAAAMCGQADLQDIFKRVRHFLETTPDRW